MSDDYILIIEQDHQTMMAQYEYYRNKLLTFE